MAFRAALDRRRAAVRALIAEMDDIGAPGQGPVMYACPMHPAVTNEEPGRCPECGMKLLATAVATSYTCPMHPEVISEESGRCPKCDMKLLVTALAAQPTGRKAATTPDAHGTHDHHGEADDHHGGDHGHGDAEGIEWEDDMVAVNRLTTPANMRWKLIDRTTGAANAAIDWHFTAGDRVKIRKSPGRCG